MRYCKLLGACLLLGCGVFLGLRAEGFLSLLRHIRAQIDCFSTPLQGIFANCDAGILADCGVEIAGPGDLDELLRGTRLYLPQECCRLLFELAGRLGGGYRADQLRCCDYYTERLSPICDRLRQDLPRREKMALILPVAGAAILALTLL